MDMGITLRVRRAAFSSEEPWAVPDGCATVRFRRVTDGHAPRLATSLAVYYDDAALYLLFSMDDDEIVATHLEHDAPLYQEDVVEAFLAPERITEYFELEANPLATTFDARIQSPDGVRQTMRADLAWTCQELDTFVFRETVDGVLSAATLLRIPFASLGRSTPVATEAWRANFFRIDRSATHGDEYSGWQPTMKTPADFHVTGAFGVVIFE
jgi:hypothetical protein